MSASAGSGRVRRDYVEASFNVDPGVRINRLGMLVAADQQDGWHLDRVASLNRVLVSPVTHSIQHGDFELSMRVLIHKKKLGVFIDLLE